MIFPKVLQESWCVMVEREMKFLVDEDKFYEMLSFARKKFSDAELLRITQINYYYDTPIFSLAKQNITLRVREINKVFCLQVKKNKETVDGIRIADEIEKKLEYLPKKINGKSVDLDPYKTYELLGKLVTNRKRFLLEDGTKIDFDINESQGKKDYEIELEIIETIPEEFVSKINVESCKHEGKYKRFLNCVKGVQCR